MASPETREQGDAHESRQPRTADRERAGASWRTALAAREPATRGRADGAGVWPSDRHNDVFFPPIRSHLLANGIAVAGLDKRGVGASTGDWLGAGIVEQADDVLAALETLSDAPDLAGIPMGIFGRSQGGWVVLEAAARGRGVAFVVTSSGPGVSPAEQERHAAADGLRRAGHVPSEVEAALTSYQSMLESIRAGASYQDFQRALEADAERRRLDRLTQVAFVPDSEAEWNFARLIIDYDPRAAMRRIRCPVLALFGAEDRSVPIERSICRVPRLAE